ncbi:icd [Symbiodinium natans]|uniref:Icd protein n=1 Tax=Symbiodinium natans TaxID=878477 RepID=A0A812PMR8_9DINO|nr:icd [Symbiodinium natans]
MKRPHPESPPEGQGTAWSGLLVPPTALYATPVPLQAQLSTAQLVDAGLPSETAYCVLCLYPVDAPTYCQACDDGPFHEPCHDAHACPAVVAVVGSAPYGEGGVDGSHLPSPTRTHASSDSHSHGGGEVCSEGEETGHIFGNLGRDDDGWPGIAKFATAEEAARCLPGQQLSVDEALPGSKKSAPAEKFRQAEPGVKPYSRGSEALVSQIERDPEALMQALEEFENDKFASSNVGNADSRQAWWARRAETANVLPYPLTFSKVALAGALLKAGGYRSAGAYFGALKRRHIELDHPWSDRLTLAVKDALRSCLRGIGPDKHCQAFDLRSVIEVQEPEVQPGWPRFPVATVVLFSLFACREVEAACRKRSQVTFEDKEGTCGVVILSLPATKNDPKAEGVIRKQGCTCSTSPELCPVRAARMIYDDGTARGGSADSPFLATHDVHQPPSKKAMVDMFRSVAQAMGWRQDAVQALTGHVLRSTGAQFLARQGIEYYRIQLFCRWGSDTVLRYLRDAPLEGSEKWLPSSLQNVSVEEVQVQTASTLSCQDGTYVHLKDAIDDQITKALEPRVTQLLGTFEQREDDILSLVKELKQTQEEVKDAWSIEFQRHFLPRYVVNWASSIVHAVKNESFTSCGCEYRGRPGFTLLRAFPDGCRQCAAAGCLQELAK